MQQSNFEQDLIESEQAFAEQFDPNSVTYHGGIKVPVPVGGARVPESMPTMYPEQQDLNQYLNKEETDYGPEYRRCMYLKEFLADLKKTLNKISATHEALLRNQELQLKVDKNNAQAVEKLENNKQNELAGLNNTLELLKTQITYLDKDEKYNTFIIIDQKIGIRNLLLFINQVKRVITQKKSYLSSINQLRTSQVPYLKTIKGLQMKQNRLRNYTPRNEQKFINIIIYFQPSYAQYKSYCNNVIQLRAAENIQLREQVENLKREINNWRELYQELAAKCYKLEQIKNDPILKQNNEELQQNNERLMKQEIELNAKIILLSTENQRLHNVVQEISHNPFENYKYKLEVLQKQYQSLQESSQRIAEENDRLKNQPPQYYENLDDKKALMKEIHILQQIIFSRCKEN